MNINENSVVFSNELGPIDTVVKAGKSIENQTIHNTIQRKTLN